MDEIVIGSKKIYSGKIINLRIDKIKLPNNKITEREIIEHPGTSAIVPLTTDFNVILVEQHRKPTGQKLLEIPAGRLENGEHPLDCAKRELFEETSYKAGNIELINKFYTTPGFCDEIIYLYLAEDLVVGTLDNIHYGEEFICVRKIKLNQALAKVYAGKIVDSKTIIGLLIVNSILKNRYIR